MDASDRPEAFRAGRGSAESPGKRLAAEAVLPAHAAGQKVLLADVSEFQPDINDAKYLAWSKAIVIRAAYGANHDDRAWYGGDRRAQLHAGGVRFLGIYQYLVAGQDPVSQAREMARLVKAMQPGEKIVCDIEEGSGNQLARWNAWAQVIRDSLGDDPWRYSGLFFGQAHGIAPVDWVAAYQATEPSSHHVLWQFTDKFAVPGVGSADCSVFHGAIDQLAALAHGGSQPVPPKPPATSWTAAVIANLPTLSIGSSGEDVKSCQGLLKARGYNVGIDGQYGPATRAAVTAFQHARGLSADGVCGPATWTKLLNR